MTVNRISGLFSLRITWVVLVAALTVTSLALKLHGAFDHPLWGDEFFQRNMTLRATWPELLSWTHDHPYYDSPAGSFILMRLVQDFTHADTVQGWRWPGILAGVLCVPLTYRLARRLGLSRVAALAAAALCASDMNLNYNSQVARSYPFQVFFFLAGLAAGAARRGPYAWLPVFLLLFAALWCHLFSFVFLGGLLLGVGAAAIARHPPKRLLPVWSDDAVFLGTFIALGGGAIYFILQWLLRDAFAPAWTPAVETTGQAFVYMRWLVGRLTWIPAPGANPALFFAGLLGLWWYGRKRASPLAWGLLGGVLAILAIQFYVLRTQLFSEPRYLLTVSMALWLGWPMLIESLPNRLRSVTMAGLLLLMPLMALRTWHNENYYGTISSARTMARSFAEALQGAAELSAGSPVRLLPYVKNIPEAAKYAGVATVSATAPKAREFPEGKPAIVWLLGNYSFTRAAIVEEASRWFPDQQERATFLAAFSRARWVVVVEQPGSVKASWY